MTRRHALLQAVFLLITVAISSSTALAQTPECFEVSKLDLWPTRYFTIADSEGTRTVAISTSTWWPDYTFYNDRFAPFLQSRVPSFTLSSVLAGRDLLEVTDKTGNAVGRLRRHRATWHAAKFTLESPLGEVWAEASVSRDAKAFLVSPPGQPARAIARAERRQGKPPDQSLIGTNDFWSVVTCGASTVPYDMMRTLAVYVSDYQDWILWSQMGVGDFITGMPRSMGNKVVEMSTEKAVHKFGL